MLYIIKRNDKEGAFTTKKTLYCSTLQVPAMVEKIRRTFVAEGYDVRIDDQVVPKEVYITKSGLFKAALGMRSALKVIFAPTRDGNVEIMVKQSKLDEKAIEAAERAVYCSSTF